MISENRENNDPLEESESEVPADNLVKLFVGQIPKEIDENELIPLFSEFGPVAELRIIRDKTNLTHKGCAFLTYYSLQSAVRAVEQLHDKVKLPKATNTLQVRIAESQAERENKLFIGMLPKVVNEQDLHAMFIPYGDLREVHIIRTPEGSSKGCAFVKFVDRESALVAIADMNDFIPQGSTRPLVVKFADTKKQAAVGGKPLGKEGLPMHSFSDSYGADKQEFWSQPNHMPHSQLFQYGGNPSNNGLSTSHMLSFGAVSEQRSALPIQRVAGLPNGSSVPLNPQHAAQYMFLTNSGYAFPPPPPPAPFSPPTSPLFSFPTSLRGGASQPQPYPQIVPKTQPIIPSNRTQGKPPNTSMRPGEFLDDTYQQEYYPDTSNANRAGNAARDNSRPPEGPPGANLFIYHLPRDLTDADLATLFAAFGNVISAKVFVDKKTSDSKGFGFVSYDSMDAAANAISAMNGFQIGSKRLKVQHKRTAYEDDGVSNQMQRIYGGMSNLSLGDQDVRRSQFEYA